MKYRKMTQELNISQYFDTFRYFQLFYEKFQNYYKRNKTGWVFYETNILTSSHFPNFPNNPYIFEEFENKVNFWKTRSTFEKLWSFSYFSNLRCGVFLAKMYAGVA